MVSPIEEIHMYLQAYLLVGVSTSPKYQRKISRKTMKGPFLHGERRQSRPHKDNQHITSSFDEDDEIPREATDFPWMLSIILFIKSTDMKISQSRSDHVLARLERSWKILEEGFNTLYNPRTDAVTPIQRRSALFGDLMNRQKTSVEKGKDPILDYVRSEVGTLSVSYFLHRSEGHPLLIHLFVISHMRDHPLMS